MRSRLLVPVVTLGLATAATVGVASAADPGDEVSANGTTVLGPVEFAIAAGPDGELTGYLTADVTLGGGIDPLEVPRAAGRAGAERELRPTSTQLLWIIDVYGFLVAGALVTMGTLGDRIGRRKLLLVGAAAFGLMSVLAAFSTTPEMLIVSRALLGLAGATVAPSTLSLIFHMFPGPAWPASGRRSRPSSRWWRRWRCGRAGPGGRARRGPRTSQL